MYPAGIMYLLRKHYVSATPTLCIHCVNMMYPAGIMYLLRKHYVSATADIMYSLREHYVP